MLSTVFSWQPFFSFSLWIILLPSSLPPFILSLLNQCYRCLVPLAWGLMAGGRAFASHGGVTLCRGWLCQRWKPLDIPGTHLHSVTQLLIILQTPMKEYVCPYSDFQIRSFCIFRSRPCSCQYLSYLHILCRLFI